MEILVPGTIQVQEKKKIFFCQTCGTVFKAEKGEYTERPDWEWNPGPYCKCPICGKNTSIYVD